MWFNVWKDVFQIPGILIYKSEKNPTTEELSVTHFKAISKLNSHFSYGSHNCASNYTCQWIKRIVIICLCRLYTESKLDIVGDLRQCRYNLSWCHWPKSLPFPNPNQVLLLLKIWVRIVNTIILYRQTIFPYTASGNDVSYMQHQRLIYGTSRLFTSKYGLLCCAHTDNGQLRPLEGKKETPVHTDI